MTPEVVLQASGHVERFTDLMVTDTLTGDCHRADHLLEAALEALLEDKKNPPSAEQRQALATAPGHESNFQHVLFGCSACRCGADVGRRQSRD